MYSKQESGGLDGFRLFAAILVISIHTSPFIIINQNLDFFFTRILSRVAVPFFFMVTGQFVVYELLDKKNNQTDKLHKYLKKIELLYAITSFFYIPLGIYAGHYKGLTIKKILQMLVFDGNFYHLWYFPACIIGMLILVGLNKFLSINKLTILTVLLYFFGIFGDSYYGITRQIPIISNIYSGAFHVFSYTRNGIFFAPIFLLMGVWCRYIQDNHISKKILIYGFMGSFFAMTIEGFLLHFNKLQRHDSMYIMLVPTMFFLYQLLLRWNISEKKVFRSMSTLIYILHPAIIVMVRILGKLLQQTTLIVNNSLLNYLMVTLLSLLSSIILIKLFSIKTHREKYAKNRAWIEINKQALAHNVQFLQSRLPEQCELMPALKAEAYGHGAVLVAKELTQLGIHSFCVACIEEAITLRKKGIKGEILILGYTHPKAFKLLYRYHLAQTVVDFQYATLLNQYGKKMKVHLGIDTGMHRLGERCENINQICQIFSMKNLKIEGIYTHLAADDNLSPEDCAFTQMQTSALNKLIEQLRADGYEIPKVHLLSSYGVLNYPEFAGDYARVGIALYGVLSTMEDEKYWSNYLTPVLTLKARITTLRSLHRGEYVGYGMAYTAKEEMKIAVLALGYADGLPRSISNGSGYVLINGQKARIIGRICMDQTIVDVSGISNVIPGGIAVIIGNSGNKCISAAEIAETSNTITNEILSRLGNRLKRFVV